LLRREPVAQVVHDAREEARLGDSEEKAQRIELDRSSDEHHRRRDDAPRDHDPSDPSPRANAGQNEIARHLEEPVAEEENPGAKAIGARAETEIAVHLQRRDRDVRAVQEVADEEDEQERQEPQAHSPNRPTPELRIVHVDCHGHRSGDRRVKGRC
jgi:hypothetical protein